MSKMPNVNDFRLAEFVGIMLGDGFINIQKTKAKDKIKIHKRIQISCNSKESGYIEYIGKIVEQLFKVKPYTRKRKNENITDILLFKTEIIDFILNDVGLKKSPKWGRATIPTRYLSKNLRKYVLRGLFDTDGSVVVTDNNGHKYPRLEIKICPSPMQNQVINIIKTLGFNCNVYKLNKEKVRLQINGTKELKRWKQLIGSDNPKHIKRMSLFLT